MAPKGTQFEPKGHQNEPKGCQRGAKSEPEINKNTTKNRNLEKGRKRGCAPLSFRLKFNLFLIKKCVKKSMWKTMPKKLQKSWKLNKKQGTIPSPETHFPTGCLQRRFLQNTVFTREKQCDGFRLPFWLTFGTFVYDLCIPFSSIEFTLISHWFRLIFGAPDHVKKRFERYTLYKKQEIEGSEIS